MTTPDDEQAQLRQQITELENRHAGVLWANGQEMRELAGLGLMLDNSSINRLRIDTFIAYVFRRMGNVSEEVRQILTWQFEIEFEERMAENLRAVKAEARKAVLGTAGQASEADMKLMWDAQQRARGNGDGPGPGPGGLILP